MFDYRFNPLIEAMGIHSVRRFVIGLTITAGFNPLIEAMGIYSCPTRITSDNGGPVSIL